MMMMIEREGEIVSEVIVSNDTTRLQVTLPHVFSNGSPTGTTVSLAD